MRPVRIESAGVRLFGMLHVPEGRLRAVAVVFLNAGLQNRVGPHRIYVQAARRFSGIGIASLRLDLPGLGDSDERLLEANFDCHDPDSIPGAVEFLRRTLGVERIVLLGLCAGARVALKAAARDSRVDAVVAWSSPILSGPVNMPVSSGGGAYMGPTAARLQFREWAPKLVNPGAWYRYLKSGKTLTEAWRMALRALSGLSPDWLRPKASRQADFLRSIDAYLAAGRKVLFVYGSEDKLPRQELLARFSDIESGRRAGCEYAVVPDGDHTFTRTTATEEVLALTSAWLERHYPQ